MQVKIKGGSMGDTAKIQEEIQNDVNNALLSGNYSLIFDALNRVNKSINIKEIGDKTDE